MNYIFFLLVGILVLGAGGYWWFFMKNKKGSDSSVNMDEGGVASKDSADMGGEKTEESTMPPTDETPAQ